MAAHRCWIWVAVVHVSCPSPFLSMHSRWRGCLSCLTAQSLVSAKGSLHKCSGSWELGNHAEQSCCLQAPQMSLAGTQKCKPKGTKLETGELGDAYTKAAMKKKNNVFVVWFCLIASQQKTDKHLHVCKWNAINKAPSTLATCVNRNPRAIWKTVY